MKKRMKEKDEKRASKREILWTLLLVFLFGAAVFLLADRPAQKRQKEEERIAEHYIADLTAENKRRREKEKAEKAGKASEGIRMRQDENWYTKDGITYTPDYARGRIQCVLKVPSAGICRGVYGGTMEDILYDLDIWMVVAARPDYVLGQTHYVIYGHNHTTQDLSFNRLSELKEGDRFSLTGSEGIFLYQVSRVYADWRESVAAQITDNFDLPKEKCYLITCGRGENRYKDLIIEGTLIQHRSVCEK